MEKIFNFNQQELEANHGIYTLTEIYQQPKVWTKVLSIIEKQKTEISKFVQSLAKNTKIIFTGAGTSEFVGNSLYPYFINLGFDTSSIATTDIVTNPHQFLDPNRETLLVSFARSGNSPESVATYEIVNEYVHQVKNLVITCNKDGQLANKSVNDQNNLVLLMPEESNDQSFAMTSSFTAMMVACWLALDLKNWEKNQKNLLKTIACVEKQMEQNYELLEKIAHLKHERIVFLGSGVFKGISQEAHLKVLELTAGEVGTWFNTPVGFRHGPKSILNQKTIAFFLMNQDQHARKYDQDLLKELASQRQLDKIVVFDFENDAAVKSLTDYYLPSGLKENDDFLLGLSYIVNCQIYAFYKSLFLNKTPDNPWPSGLVNRVVEGVVIHKFKG